MIVLALQGALYYNEKKNKMRRILALAIMMTVFCSGGVAQMSVKVD